MLTEQKYKDLSIKEFTKAAEVYDSGHAGVYEMCKDDYPPVYQELKEYPFQELSRQKLYGHRFDSSYD